jgi:hypothetical protein
LKKESARNNVPVQERKHIERRPITLLTFCFDPFGIFLKRAKNQNESKRIKKVSFCKVFEKGVDPFGFWHGF